MKRKQHQNREGQIARIATIALAMGLGFGVGLMYSRSKKTRDKPRNESPPYRIESQIEGYEDRGRLEYKQPDDRLSYRGGSARAHSSFGTGSGYLPNNEDRYEHWR